MIKIQRLKINDIIHSFCWQCRNAKTAEHSWPYLLCGWQMHMGVGDSLAKSGHPKHRYCLFIAYASRYHNGSMRQFCALLSVLEIATCRWNATDWEYANNIMDKYYGT